MKREAVAAGVAAGVAALAVAVFARTLAYGFVDFDDDIYVTGNPAIQLGLSAAGIRWAFTTLYAAFWHPVTWLSLLADFEWGGLDGRYFHLTNLALHTANALLLFLLLRRWTGSIWRSGCVAALFAVHPLHVESVAWIAERKDVLSSFFGFLTLAAYTRYAAARKAGWYAAALALFVLSLAAKPMLVTLPVLLVILDYWPLRRLSDPAIGKRKILLEKVPFLVLGLAASVMAVVAQQKSGALPLEPGPLWYRAVTAVLAGGTYLAKMVWPVNLAPFYPWQAGWPLAPVAASFAVLAGLTVLCFRQARRKPWLLAGWLWFGVSLLPVSGLIRVGSHAWADRYTYLPLIGVWLAAVWELGARVGERPARRRAAAGAAGAVIVALAVGAWRQAGYWRDTETLFVRTLAVTAPNPMIESNLSAVLFRKGRLAEAREHALRAVGLNPQNASARNNLGVVLNALGQPEAALAEYEEAAALKPDYAEALANLGGLLLQAGRTEEAVPHLEKAAALKPADDKALCNLGSAYFLQGRVDAAAAEYEKALRANPSSVTAVFNLGAVRERQGRYAEAARWFERAAALKPGDPEALRRMREAQKAAEAGAVSR